MAEEPINQNVDLSSATELEHSLVDGTQDDARLSNGVQDIAGNDDLTFINMSGLIGPVKDDGEYLDPESKVVDYDDADMDPEAPVSFYEEGVDDVDSGMNPENASSMDTEDVLSPVSGDETDASSSLDYLQDIISELKVPETENDADSSSIADQESIEVEDLTAQNLEAALDGLVVPIDTVNTEALTETVDAPIVSERVQDVDLPVTEKLAGINLGEAEQLLNELESQDREDPISATIETPVPATPESLLQETPAEPPNVKVPNFDIASLSQQGKSEEDITVYSKPPLANSSTRNKHRRKRSISLAQLFILLIFVIGVSALGFYGFSTYRNQTLTPGESLQVGTDLLNAGEYRKASNYLSTMVPAPEKGTAEFLAAYALQLIPVGEQVPEHSAYYESLEKFDTFITNNPTHEKVARAETFMGILYYKVGRSTEALQLLEDPRLRIRDQVGYLPTLRTLAHLYADAGEMNKAHHAIMQAVNHSDNITPDKDLITLADMFIEASERTTNKEARIDAMSQAVTLWNQASNLPTLLKVTREDLEFKRDYYQGIMETLEATEGDTVPVYTSPIPADSGTTNLPLSSAVAIPRESDVEETSTPKLPFVSAEPQEKPIVKVSTPNETEVIQNSTPVGPDLDSLRIPEDL